MQDLRMLSMIECSLISGMSRTIGVRNSFRDDSAFTFFLLKTMMIPVMHIRCPLMLQRIRGSMFFITDKTQGLQVARKPVQS